MKNGRGLLLLLSVCVLGIAGCGKRGFVKGDYDENVEQVNLLNDQWSESDMQKIVKDLVASALAHPAIAGAKTPPIVMVTRLQNKTDEHIETQSITDMIQVELMKSGKVQFVDAAAREDIAKEYEYQEGGSVSKETKRGKGKQIGADLIMNGRIESITQEVGKDKTIYYKVTMNMTNLSTGLIVWTDQKQIRKIYRKKRLGL